MHAIRMGHAWETDGKWMGRVWMAHGWGAKWVDGPYVSMCAFRVSNPILGEKNKRGGHGSMGE